MKQSIANDVTLQYPQNNHDNYHAHIYFEQETYRQASQFCQLIDSVFEFTVGTIHKKPIGPHTQWSCQVTFTNKDFDVFVPWLDTHRNGLSILVHALTGEHLKDHTEYAYWLGSPVLLKLSVFK